MAQFICWGSFPPRFKLDASSEEGAIYFLGSLLYELLSAEKPFEGRRDTVEMEHAHFKRAVLKFDLMNSIKHFLIKFVSFCSIQLRQLSKIR